MPYDKLVDSAFLDNGLKQIADSIRAKTGTEDELAFPSGMSEAIDGISGGDAEKYVFDDYSYFCCYNSRLDELDKIDTSNATNFSHMFEYCFEIVTAPEVDTSNGTDFSYMFRQCGSMTSVPKINTSNGTNFSYMFSAGQRLTTIPKIDTSNGTNFSYMFTASQRLTTIPELDTSNGTNFLHMCSNAGLLQSVLKLDINKATQTSAMFDNCTNLTDLYLYNIRRSIQIGSGTSWGHLLTVDSLVHTIKELCTVKSSATLTMGAANLEKIANLYCRITDDTTDKIEMELCESTDEGAMTLSEYASLKNWTFA